MILSKTVSCPKRLWTPLTLIVETNNTLIIQNITFFALEQGQATSVLEGQCPAEFSSNPNQAHMKKLINVFKITRKLQAGVFD